MWKDLNPFYGEEFFVDLAQDFQEVAVLVFDQDKLKSDDPMGKVCFSRKQIEEGANGGLIVIDDTHARPHTTRTCTYLHMCTCAKELFISDFYHYFVCGCCCRC